MKRPSTTLPANTRGAINPRTRRPDGRRREWRPADPLVIDFVQDMAALKIGDRTIREYSRDVELFGAFLQGHEIADAEGNPYRGPFGKVFLTATQSSIRRFMMHLGGLKYKAAATRRKLAVLRRFFHFLKRENHRKDNPALEIQNVRLPKRLPKAIPVPDVMRLIGARPFGGKRPSDKWELRLRRDVAIIELLYASGMRRAELAGIELSELDFTDRSIRVIGKGNKQRKVFFNHATEDALQAYLRVRPRSKDGALFVTTNGNRLSYQQVGRIFATYVALSGLEGRITPHTMRHSIATHLHKSGVDLMTIKEFLGHESIQTTQIYAEMTQEHVRRSLEKHHPRDKSRPISTLSDKIDDSDKRGER